MVFNRISPLVVAVLFMAACDKIPEKPAATSSASASNVETLTQQPRRHAKKRNRQTRGLPDRVSAGLHTTGFAGPMLDRRKQTIAFGTVTLPDGTAAHGAEVTLWSRANDDMSTMPWHRSKTALSDAQGRFRVMGIRDDKWALSAKHPGFSTEWISDDRNLLHNGTGFIEWPVDLQLAKEVIVRGRVEGSAGAQPAMVFVRYNTWRDVAAKMMCTYTQPDGSFEIRGVRGSKANLCAIGPGTNPYTTYIDTAEYQVVPRLKKSLPVVGKVTSEFDLSKTTVTVSLQSTGAPPIFRFRTTTNRNNGFSLPPVPAGEYYAMLAGDPFQLRISGGERISGVPVVATDIYIRAGSTEELTLSAITGKKVIGKVIDEETGKPVAGVRVYNDTLNMSFEKHETVVGGILTTASGEFSLAGIYEYSDVQIASDDYYAPTSVEELISHVGADTTVTVPLRRAPFVRGRVTAPSGTLPAGTSVIAFGELRYFQRGESFAVAPDGSFQIRAKHNRLTLAAQAPGFKPVFSKELIVARSDMDNIVLALGSGREISGMAIDAMNNPVAGAPVWANSVRSGWTMDSYVSISGVSLAKTVTDAAGRFKLDDVPRETGVLLSTAESDESRRSGLYHARPGHDPVDNVKLVVQEFTSITLYVTDPQDRPVTGAKVMFRGAAQEVNINTDDETNTSGSCVTYRLPRLTTLTLSITKAGYQKYDMPVQISSPELRIQLQPLNRMSIFLRHLDAETLEPVDADIESDEVFEKVPEKPGEYKLTGSRTGEKYRFSSHASDYSWKNLELYPELVGEGNTYTILMHKDNTWIGRVIDGETHEPVADARISAYGSDRVTTRTDSNGYFHIRGSSYSRGYVAAKGDLRSRRFSALSVAAGKFDLGDIELERQAELTIVVRMSSGKPVEGTLVKVAYADYNRFRVNGTTNEIGEYTPEIPQTGDIGIMLPEFHQTRKLPPALAGESDRRIVFEVGTGAISGAVTLDGQPVRARLTATRTEIYDHHGVATDSGGNYEIDKLSAGSWKLKVTSSGSGGIIRREVVTEVPADETPVKLDIDLAKIPDDHTDGEVSFKVETEAGEPVPGAVVSLKNIKSGSNESESTDSHGEVVVRLENVAGYTAFASKVGTGRSKVYPLTERDVASDRPIKLTLTGGDARIVCTVLSEFDGQPVLRARGELIDENMNYVANAIPGVFEGDLLFDGVQAGEYVVRVSAPGFGEQTQAVSATDGQDAELAVVLGPAADLTITVMNKDGRLLPGCAVLIQPGGSGLNESPRTGVTDEQGVAKFQGVGWGAYKGYVTNPESGTTGQQFRFSPRNQETMSFAVQLR